MHGETIKSAQNGDRAAFARLVDDHYDLMFRFALKYTGNREDAEDITQLSCIKLGRFIHQYRFEAAFSSWLYRLVINCARDFYKRQKSSEPLDDNPGTSVTGNPGEQLVLLHEVLEKIDSMGAGFRETVALIVGEGLSHADTAEVLAVKESTVSWRMHEIRKRLSRLLPAEDGDE